MRHFKLLATITGSAALAIAIPATPPAALPSLAWELLPTGSRQRFCGLSSVSDKIAWVSGTNGTVLRTTDGGLTWDSAGPALSADDPDLDFRDIEAITANHVVLLSIGEGANSRIYVTRDAGQTWTQASTNNASVAFYDCIALTSTSHGLAMSDPVDGKFRLVETIDGGESWVLVGPTGMLPAQHGKFGFAASGTCWPGKPRIPRTPIAGGDAAGVFSVQFRDEKHGIAVGGDYTLPNETVANAAWSKDGGETWQASAVRPGEYRSGASRVPGLCNTALAVGPTGFDITLDGGRTWRAFENGSFDSVQCSLPGVCWASGEQGRVARLRFK
ncbi:Oxidoreductase [Pleurostoma richardsiae]|uniref:Oxidoreductase n=1 Tax=Pleurostoma richardsiae TaxID=41990 RepID=A0AA38RSV7_9PEZI|nr:Oxidoreductase [Pleurostoma richardsiae]